MHLLAIVVLVACQSAQPREHWSFRSLAAPVIPKVSDPNWIETGVDAYILSGLERVALTPARRAPPATLIRRVYLDLIGLPPTPEQIREFASQPTQQAYQRLVDKLLASPQYGERWGRHWLDVARYADSNGGDENHAFPHAYRYRNYVIDALNQAKRFDRFIHEQLAGDLLLDTTDPAAITATGFLAVGMKILAEQDKTKMKADFVDEQIETIGKAFLGLSINCARCHDHKFDPIPARDYYALAGVLHSTMTLDRLLETPGYLVAKQQYAAELGSIERQALHLEESLERATAKVPIVNLEAEEFARGNVQKINDGYGAGIGVISDPGAQDNFVEYDIDMTSDTEVLIQIRYAAKNARPGRILVNGKQMSDQALAQVTGGWFPQHQRWFNEGTVRLGKGRNVLRVESAPLMSHLDRIRLIPAPESGVIQKLIAAIENLENSRRELEKKAPAAPKVMAVRDQHVGDIRIHERGSHLNLGEPVPRGFLSVFGVTSNRVPETASGRKQLAFWLTEPDSRASALAARVMANRIWTWHFGRGLAESSDNFGFQQGQPQQHQLLDYLAARLAAGWSLKRLHREILLSRTYQSSSETNQRGEIEDPSNRRYWRWPGRRLEAEAIRDCMLFHSGRLSLTFGSGIMAVKSQDPSPQDVLNNLKFYRSSPRRSVYLPVVRSNVYEFFQLFDFPNAATSTGTRHPTTVPTQALLLLNDPFVIEQAEALAARVLAARVSDRQSISDLFLRLFARAPSDAEMESLLEFVGNFRAHSDSELTVWTGLCQTLFASNEFLYLN